MGRRGKLGLLLVAVLFGMAAPARAGELETTCLGADVHLAGPCRGVEVVAAAGSAVCRQTPAPDEACATPLNPAVSAAAVDAHTRSWLHRTLAYQYDLGSSVPLVNAPWLGTHNSFNSADQLPTVSWVDANQQLSLTDQLRIDIRSLELDVHWFPSVWAGGAYAPVLCHARGADEEHAGCTTERLFDAGLREVRAWLDSHRDQVLLIYVEDHLAAGEATGPITGAGEGSTAAATMLDDVLGNRLYRPPWRRLLAVAAVGDPRPDARRARAGPGHELVHRGDGVGSPRLRRHVARPQRIRRGGPAERSALCRLGRPVRPLLRGLDRALGGRELPGRHTARPRPDAADDGDPRALRCRPARLRSGPAG
jgi:hypothetical protein